MNKNFRMLKPKIVRIKKVWPGTSTGLPLVREKSGKFKVREKAGNFEIGQGNLEICEESGKFRKMALRSGECVLLPDKWTLNVNTTLCKFIVFIIYPIRIASVNLQMPSIYNSIIGHRSLLYNYGNHLCYQAPLLLQI